MAHLQAQKEILAHLVFLGEMVILGSLDNQVLLVLLAPPESVNHVHLLIRIYLNLNPMMSSLEEEEDQAFQGHLVFQDLLVLLVHLVILVPLVLMATKVLMDGMEKKVKQVHLV